MIVKPTARYPKSRWIARSQPRQRFLIVCPRDAVAVAFAVAGSASAIPLLFPRVRVIVVAAGLPVAGRVVLHEAHAGEPLRALPEVEVGDQAADGRAVLQRE